MLDQYFGDYITVLVFMAVGAVIVGGGLLAASLLRPDHPTKTHIRYYIFALLFLIFDVEAVFIFPWALNVEGFAEAGMGGFIFVEMVIFIVILLLGLVYAIRKGVLRWE